MGRIDRTFSGWLNESKFWERYKDVLKDIMWILRCDIQSFIEKEREFSEQWIPSESGRGDDNFFLKGLEAAIWEEINSLLKGLEAAVWARISPHFEVIRGCCVGEYQSTF